MEEISKTEMNSNQKQFFSHSKKLKKKGKSKNKITMTNNMISFKNKNNNNKDKKIKKARNPGVDLVRIIAMYNIVLNHSMFHGHGPSHFPKYKRNFFFKLTEMSKSISMT